MSCWRRERDDEVEREGEARWGWRGRENGHGGGSRVGFSGFEDREEDHRSGRERAKKKETVKGGCFNKPVF